MCMMPIGADGCLFCGDTEAPKTDEHVLQAGFGADLRLVDEVCGRCNTERFSPLDTAVIDFARNLVFAHHPDVTPTRTILNDGHPVTFDDSVGHWVSVRVLKQGQAFLPPQIVVVSTNQVGYHADNGPNALALAALFRQELSQPELLEFETAIVDIKQEGLPPVQPAIVRSAPGKYVLRARTAEEAAKLEQVVRTGLFGTWSNSTDPTARPLVLPRIHGGLHVRLGHYKRAVAKTALNFVCATLGGEFARGAAFDDLRRFVLSEYDDSLDLVEIAARREGAPDPALVFGKSGHHTLFLGSVGGVAVVVIFLYQKLFATVWLAGKGRSQILARDTMIVGLFDYKRKTERILRAHEDPFEFGAVMGFGWSRPKPTGDDTP